MFKILALFMMFAFLASAPMAEAQWNRGADRELSPKEKRKRDRQDAKQARQVAQLHYKEYMVKKRKALILLKKIEDERSRNASVRSFKLLFEVEDADSADQPGGDRVIGGARGSSAGRYGEDVPEEAKKKAMDAERKKYERQLEKLHAQMEAEQTRIEEAELMTDEVQDFIKKSME